MTGYNCLIIDLGVGNSHSLYNFLRKLNHKVVISNLVREVEDLKFDFIFLPGVGSFDYAATELHRTGWDNYLINIKSENEVKIIGICLGMQLLSEGSQEGTMPGLGFLPGFAIKFDERLVRVPHMGWNITNFTSDRFSLNNITDARYYFAHSYYFPLENSEFVLATTNYQVNFASALSNNNILGFQFHLEKSHSHGFKLMKQILEYA